MKILLVFLLILQLAFQQITREPLTIQFTPPEQKPEIVIDPEVDTDSIVLLGYSGDSSSSVIKSEQGSAKSPPYPINTRTVLPKVPEDILKAQPLGQKATVLLPGTTSIVFNTGWLVMYEICFYTDCPQNPVTLTLFTTDPFYVIKEENMTSYILYPSSGWGSPLTIHHITLSPSNLTCGQNKIRVLLFNWQNPSWYAIWYTLTQNNKGCYNCPNLGDTFYNSATCKCECSFRCGCDIAKQWIDYPVCGCRCRYPVSCIGNRWWNARTCHCDCKSICCPPGQIQSSTTCECYPAK